MESWLQHLFNWLPSGVFFYALIGLISFIESLALIGIFFPGSVLIVFAGFLCANGKGEFAILFIWATAGSISGDIISYMIGARMGERLLTYPIFKKRKDLIHKAEQFFYDHGGKSVLAGRFVGFLRPFIPFIAGSARMRPLLFTLYAVVSGILWGFAYPGLGYFFGTSWQQVQVWSGRLSLLVAILVGLFILNAIFWKWLFPRLARLANSGWQRLSAWWQRWLASPAAAALAGRFPRLWNFVAERFSPRQGAGLYLTVGFAVSALFASLFIVLAEQIRLHETLRLLDERVYHLMQGLHYHPADTFFVTVTYFGSAPVLLMVGAVAVLWLLMNNRDYSAALLAAGTVGGELLVFLLKAIFHRPRPVPVFPDLSVLGTSFPSAHAFVALVFYGLLVYMLLGSVRNFKGRVSLVTGGSFFALLIGFSRVYLGVHWLSDVLGGFALAGLWLAFLITASEIRRRYAGELPWRKGWQPFRLHPLVKALVLLVAALLAAAGIVAYLAARLTAL
jgi:membrane protein DedA with SNARE-associated domain/membrane-associated phospholipid phosphatase